MISLSRRQVLLPCWLLMLGLLAPGCVVAPVSAPELPPGLPSATALLDMAGEAATVDDRAVLVKFRASWCVWCARLDAALHSFELGWLIEDNYVLVDITVQESDDKLGLETPGGQELMDTMGGAAAGLPFYAFLDASLSKLADSNAMPDGGNIGYPVTPEEIASFDDLLARTAPRMAPEHRDRVGDYLSSRPLEAGFRQP